jgi:hypothetical protein
MKKILLLLVTGCILQSCIYSDDDDVIIEPGIVDFGSEYEAIVLDRPTFESSVSLEESRNIVDSGKIYVLEGLLFVGEDNEGFHIYDNDDPTNPTPLGFIKAPGATDLAIKNNVYYINQAVDLIAVVYNKDESNLTVTKRIRDVFPPKITPDGFFVNTPADSIVVDFELIN